MILEEEVDTNHYKSGATCNACKLCTPLGACMVFAGVEQCISILHGSQGCSTYIRRYMISHFREPVDIASSSFTEEDTVYGGARNLAQGIDNLIQQYRPAIIGVGTTCLSETIGEDVASMVKKIEEGIALEQGVELVHVSTPSYTGTHTDGFHGACMSLVKRFAEGYSIGKASNVVNLLPNLVSPADLRHYREIIEDLSLTCTMIPDYSDTLDGVSWSDYHRIPEGGTPRNALVASGTSRATVECGALLAQAKESAARHLEKEHHVERYSVGMPVGLRETDAFINALEKISGEQLSKRLSDERGRLVDSMFDAHKYLFGKKVAVYGDPDLVIGLVSLICELGMVPVITATGGKHKGFKEAVKRVLLNVTEDDIQILTGTDHVKLHDKCVELKPDLILGSSKGYSIARKANIPLVRIGFPIHDRMGGQRLLHIGYRGAQSLFDRIVNTLLEKKQAAHDEGYTYL